MILSTGNQQYEYPNRLLQNFSLQITIFLSDHKNFSSKTFAVHDIKNQDLQKMLYYFVTGCEKTDLIYAKYTYS